MDGNAAYDILEPAAWDNLETTPTLLHRAAAAQAIVFGTLAQRNGVTRDTLRRMLDTRALKVLDVNLRPPYDDREIVRDSLRRADVVKLNEEEMRRLASWFDLRGDLRAERAGVEARDTTDGGGPPQRTTPEFRDATADRRHDTDAGDRHGLHPSDASSV